MARNIKRRLPQAARHVAWNETFNALFRLGKPFEAPATVQVRQTVKGYTLTAIFRDEGGQAWRAMTRVAWIDGGERVRVIDETISATFKVGAR